MGGTALYDSIYLACDEVVKKQQGRKALVLLTDGVDRGSKYTLSMAIESAQRADTMLYSVLFADQHGYDNRPTMMGPGMGGRRRMGYPGGGYPGGGYPGGGYPGGGGGGGNAGANGKKVLTQMADETGGRFFEVTKKLPLDKIYEEIEEELRSQYSIGYTSDTPLDQGRMYRKIAVTVPKQKTYTIRTREGYYAS
jgi:VWFA-related protein